MKEYVEILIKVTSLVGGSVTFLLLPLALVLVFSYLFGAVHGFFLIFSLILGFMLGVSWAAYYWIRLTKVI